MLKRMGERRHPCRSPNCSEPFSHAASHLNCTYGLVIEVLNGRNKIYCKNSKNWDTLNYYRDCPTNGIVGFYSAILRSKDADRITNRVDTDQTAP